MLLGVDVGGTFTDAALHTGDRIFTAKASTTPQDQSAGVEAAVGEVLDRSGARAGDVERFLHGMTVGTNALLEGDVARTALLATAGFTDLEELRRQTRPELYRLCVGHPPPLAPPALRVAVHERMGPEGIVEPLDEERLRESLRALDEPPEALAVCLLWSFRHPDHERRVAEVAADELPRAHVSTSHATAPVFREYERCATTIVDAALSPLLRTYLRRLAARARELGLPPPEVMLSGGGVADAGTAAEHGSWTVLSGPAGGAVGAARMAERAVSAAAVCVDMGGTSCDVSLASGGSVRQSGGREVGGRALALPMVDVHTVGAGGGSVAWLDAGGALRVGPRSAGAEPGPACYGRGGEEPTVTDANLVLGRIDREAPLAGGVTLDAGAAARVVSRLADALDASLEDAAASILRVASTEMARAVRVMTVERGEDPRAMALVAFGGAGPLHAAEIAEELGVRRIVVPNASSVLSALGLVLSERRRDLVESVLLTGAGLTRAAVARTVAALAARGRRELGAPEADVRASFDLRYAGEAFELTVPGSPEPEPEALRRDFEALHEQRYGYVDPDGALELVTIRVTVAEPGAEPAGAADPGVAGERTRSIHLYGGWHDAAVVTGRFGSISGPAACELPETTLVVPPDWRAVTDADGTIVLERS